MAAAAALLIAGAAFAEQGKAQNPLALEIKAAREVRIVKNGTTLTALEPADEMRSGDIIVYTLNYKNRGKEPLKGVKLTDPLPEGVSFIPGSMFGDKAAVTFSIDGGKTYHSHPVKYKATMPDGSVKEREATPDMFTHIRWVLKDTLKPGASGQVGFKARVK
jgi:uncharacterized repeat protein (TIGR01451 family)